ncbi:uncharacterized protein KY384_007384 [Bacidia gigantensis]|uniref:uncharacterized protein n=1 Tax=Bacidia gigantensis TaxID=2732470 RepID=UPI001D04E1ED|nr:uncharacterized protein KY384_007384 [Bacidia gigantensis]KAG8528466.1 hypothetical protein KY384_007384 [Bacidia gigantensis]
MNIDDKLATPHESRERLQEDIVMEPRQPDHTSKDIEKQSLDPLPPAQIPSAPSAPSVSSLSSIHPTPKTQSHLSTYHRAQTYLAAEISTTHTDLLLLCCCFISGLVDSTIYDAFGTFVSMQTGNTVFLGLGSSTPHNTSKPYGWAKSFVSLVCFALGCFSFSHSTRLLGNLRRGTLALSFGVQAILVFIAAAVVQGGVANGNINTITDDIDWWEVLPIAFLSFQSAGQIVGSRALSLAEIPTVVLTSLIHDLTTDRMLLAKPRENVKRNRRAAGFFCLLGGSVAGGWIAEGTERMQIPLWIAGGIKVGIAIAWALWPAKKRSPV